MLADSLSSSSLCHDNFLSVTCLPQSDTFLTIICIDEANVAQKHHAIASSEMDICGNQKVLSVGHTAEDGPSPFDASGDAPSFNSLIAKLEAEASRCTSTERVASCPVGR